MHRYSKIDASNWIVIWILLLSINLVLSASTVNYSLIAEHRGRDKPATDLENQKATNIEQNKPEVFNSTDSPFHQAVPNVEESVEELSSLLQKEHKIKPFPIVIANLVLVLLLKFLFRWMCTKCGNCSRERQETQTHENERKFLLTA